MTSLQIVPNWKNKTARFKGTIAAGEHIAVSIVNVNENGDEFIADTENLRLRVVDECGRTLAQFPMPAAEGETPDAWDGLTPLSCTLNLNTVQMLSAVPPGANVPLLFVLDAYREDDKETPEYEGEFTLYFKDRCEVTHWPRRRGEEEPVNLDDYQDIIADFRNDIYGVGGFKERVENAEAAATQAAESAGNSESGAQAAMESASTFANAAGVSATAAGNSATAAAGSETNAAGSASAAADSAELAEKWATGGSGGTDIPSATNNAKHYSEVAQSAAEVFVIDDELATAGAAADAKATGDAIAAEAEARQGAIEAAISGEVANRNNAITAAISAIKNSAPEVFDTLKEIADWIMEDPTRAAAITDRIAALEDGKVGKEVGKGLSTEDYTTAEKNKLGGIENGAKVNVQSDWNQDDPAYDDYIKNRPTIPSQYVLPPATAQTLGGVKQGPGVTIAADGTISANGGGGGGTVDDAVTRTSENAVKSSGIWSAIWGALTALPTGFASLYDWCVARLAGKRGLKDLAVYGDAWVLTLEGASESIPLALTDGFPLETWTDTGVASTATFAMQRIDTTAWRLLSAPSAGGIEAVARDVPQDATEMVFVSGADNVTVVARALSETVPVTGDSLAKTSQIPAAQVNADWNATSGAALILNKPTISPPPAASDAPPQTDGTASAGESAEYSRGDHVHPTDTTRAAAADLPYALVAPEPSTPSLPAGVTVKDSGGNPVANDVLDIYKADDIYILAVQSIGTDIVTWDDDGTQGVYYGDDYKLYYDNQMLQTPPNLVLAYPLADHAINGVVVPAAGAATLAFPAAVEGKVRDFLVRLTLGEGASVNFPDTVKYETEGGEWPDFTEAGTYIVRLTETEEADATASPAIPARFLMQVSSVAEATAPSAGGGE